MVEDKDLDTHKEIKLEKARIELEKEKADLLKHKFDAYLAIARDIGLIVIIIASTLFNLMSMGVGKINPTPAIESIGDKVTMDNSLTEEIKPIKPKAMLKKFNLGDLFNVHIFLWIIVVMAVIFLIIPRFRRIK